MAERWWYVAGESLWAGDGWRLLFLWDSGSLWGLSFGRSDDRATNENMHWDYQTESLVEGPPPQLRPELVKNLYGALKRASPLTRRRMTDLQMKILDSVAATVTEQIPWVTGRKLRKEFEAFGKEAVNAAAQSLCPRYMQQREGTDFYFEPTFIGLLESGITGKVSQLVEAILLELNRAYNENPDVRELQWSTVREALHSDNEKGLLFAQNVMRAMEWQPSGWRQDGARWTFTAPEDAEDASRCTNLAKYLEYLRRQAKRPWLTCPERPRTETAASQELTVEYGPVVVDKLTQVEEPRVRITAEHNVIPQAYSHLLGDLSRFDADAPFDRSVFVMMKFADPAHMASWQVKCLDDLYAFVKDELDRHGLVARRADKKTYASSKQLWDNLCIYMLGCRYGVALLEDHVGAELNPNVALEYGFMKGLGREVVLLKERRFKHLRADLLGTIPKDFDIGADHDIDGRSVRDAVSNWLIDVGVPPKRAR